LLESRLSIAAQNAQNYGDKMEGWEYCHLNWSLHVKESEDRSNDWAWRIRVWLHTIDGQVGRTCFSKELHLEAASLDDGTEAGKRKVGDQREKLDAIHAEYVAAWSSTIATLGTQGWEAIGPPPAWPPPRTRVSSQEGHFFQIFLKRPIPAGD
jgi:hypothetical protein